ncbi:hypothetical protein HZA99_03560 [Candidatus Woesearchaeota archaeon]|nr:hypothetical protein [Candidatus Woesearchaeota archaeon]
MIGAKYFQRFHRGHIVMYATIILAILFGWVAHSIYIDYAAPQRENPLVPGKSSVLTKLNSMLTFSSAEIMSPQDHISEDAIHVSDANVVLDIPHAQWSSFTDTNSMDPLLDVGANGIEIIPHSADDIHLGDVISYQSGSDMVIHRVIGIDSDDSGIYYTIKGDNNPIADNVRVRFADVSGILVAVVY